MRVSARVACISLQACYTLAPDPALCGSASTAPVAVARSPLVAVFSGGNVVTGERPLTISCGSSYDPDASPGQLAFDWSCNTVGGPGGGAGGGGNGGVCLGPDNATPVAFNPGSPTQTVQLHGTALGAEYNVTCVVSKDTRAASASARLTVRQGQLPLISLRGLLSQKASANRPVYAVVSI